MRFHLSQVQVLNPDKSPAKGVHVLVNPGSVPGVTSEDGMATLTINTDPSSSQIVVKVSFSVLTGLSEAAASEETGAQAPFGTVLWKCTGLNERLS